MNMGKTICSGLLVFSTLFLGTPLLAQGPPGGSPPGGNGILALEDALADVEARVAELEALLADVSRGIDPNTGYDTIQFSGMNVQLVNGSGATESTNGTGNLIIGYNELRTESNSRDGSHMLVIGGENNYTASSHSGVVVGWSNEVDAPFASIIALGSWVNARGAHVLGGINNRAHGELATVAGGSDNAAIGLASSITGGKWNEASGDYASVIGGESNRASALNSSVAGGRNNLANVSGWYASISGGDGNETGGIAAHISGGFANKGWGDMSTVSGGENNIASHNKVVVSGGKDVLADSEYEWAAADVMPRLANAETGLTSLETTHAAHSADAFAHHARYEDAEAIAAVGPHYSDAEAIAALEPQLSGFDSRMTAAEGDISTIQSSSVFDLEPYVSVVDYAMDNLSGPHILFEGVNVHVRSGSGSTDDGGTGAYYGLGNLIIGYNENCCGGPNNRAGSHNLVVGPLHQYTSHGGFVAGYRNELHAKNASVSGGYENIVDGSYSSIMGGHFNKAHGLATSVSGGQFNAANNQFSNISGGANNQTNGTFASVSGGYDNRANGFYTSVSGGRNNVAGADYSVVIGGNNIGTTGSLSVAIGGADNLAKGEGSVVIAGEFNESIGVRSAVIAGQGNAANGLRTAVFGGAINTTDVAAEDSATLGGRQNHANGWFSTVSGGEGNTAAGWAGTVSGGAWRTSSGDYDWVAGTLWEDG